MAFFNKRSSSGIQEEETEAARADMEFELLLFFTKWSGWIYKNGNDIRNNNKKKVTI